MDKLESRTNTHYIISQRYKLDVLKLKTKKVKLKTKDSISQPTIYIYRLKYYPKSVFQLKNKKPQTDQCEDFRPIHVSVFWKSWVSSIFNFLGGDNSEEIKIFTRWL